MEYPAGNVSMEESGSDPMVMANGNENGSEKTQNGELAQQQDRGKRYNHFLVCGQLFEVDAKYKPIKPVPQRHKSYKTPLVCFSVFLMHWNLVFLPNRIMCIDQ